ncbi:Hachiman antiphage defense system protein HamA [Amycolatopsis sp. NPDC051045]|uniref:Hachiman antiphage defense system protein HamA n=1 Tax=Amycolatopsis sp. NPDC051045 TaxID=3156922 RepID=UPI003449AE73
MTVPPWDCFGRNYGGVAGWIFLISTPGTAPARLCSNSQVSFQARLPSGSSHTSDTQPTRGRMRERRDMANFHNWCTVGLPAAIGGQLAGVIKSFDDVMGATTLAAELPHTYARADALARIADRLGKNAVARHLRNKLPTKASARSGDMGEILATAYLHEEQGCVVGPSRLIERDHQEWAMRGDDALAAKFGHDGKLIIIKAEAKSRVRLGGGTVAEAREGLARNEELPSPQSLAQFSERLLSTPDSDVGDAVLTLQLREGVRPDRVAHLMFLFTSSDPSAYVAADLVAYKGSVSQLTVTLHVQGHKEFIKNAYEKVIFGGP